MPTGPSISIARLRRARSRARVWRENAIGPVVFADGDVGAESAEVGVTAPGPNDDGARTAWARSRP